MTMQTARFVECRGSSHRQHASRPSTGNVQGAAQANVDGRAHTRSPGQVEGSYNAQNQLVASSIKFKGNDLQDAQTIQAGIQPAKEQIQQTQQELAEQKAALARQQQEMQQQQQQMAEAQAKIDANKAAIEAANKRFGQLADYNILDEVTVYFGNGKVALDPKYNAQLMQLAEKAKTITGYTIQVKGYASSVGSASLNQKLSDERANNVAQFLQQQGHIPLTKCWLRAPWAKAGRSAATRPPKARPKTGA
jgi:OmpA-OmpF porin, OOP family